MINAFLLVRNKVVYVFVKGVSIFL